MDFSSQQQKNHLLPFTCTSPILEFHFLQPNCPSLLAGEAGKRAGEGNGGRELRNCSANYMLMKKM